MSDNAFLQTLEAIAELAQAHPDYQFEYIQPYIDQLRVVENTNSWSKGIANQWDELSETRQEACRQIFDYALLRARQTNYRPVNELDAFLDRQLYGVQDTQSPKKGLVSQALKQIEERKRPPSPPAGPPGPPPSRHPGRTNPLNPRNLPPGPLGKPPEG